MSVIDTINIKGTDYDIQDKHALTIDIKGMPNGVAELDENGQIPSSQLPSGIGGISEYNTRQDFPQIGEDGKLYIAKDTNLMWRWDGNEYITISSDLELGETSTTAYRGDRGKIAYDHSQTIGNPHGTTKSDLGLGNVSDNKSVAVDELQNLTPTEKETARINIGAGTLADVRVNGTSVVDIANIAQIKSYTEITQAEYDALPDSKYTDNIMYCITDAQNGGIYLSELTQAEYDALPASVKNSNNTIFFITDGGGSGGSGVTDVIVNGVSVVDDGVATITTTDENVARTSIDTKDIERSVIFSTSSEGTGGVYTSSYLRFDPNRGVRPNLILKNKSDATYSERADFRPSYIRLYSADPADSGNVQFGFSVENSGSNTSMFIKDTDIEIRTYQSDTTSTAQTWDGIHTSLKDSISYVLNGTEAPTNDIGEDNRLYVQYSNNTEVIHEGSGRVGNLNDLTDVNFADYSKVRIVVSTSDGKYYDHTLTPIGALELRDDSEHLLGIIYFDTNQYRPLEVQDFTIYDASYKIKDIYFKKDGVWIK